MLGTLAHETGEPEIAADPTAEVFAQVMISVQRYRPRQESAGAWLLAIARIGMPG